MVTWGFVSCCFDVVYKALLRLKNRPHLLCLLFESDQSLQHKLILVDLEETVKVYLLFVNLPLTRFSAMYERLIVITMLFLFLYKV